MIFCIPLLPKSRASNWDQVVRLLNQTLRSLQNQSSKAFSVIIACHDEPELHQEYDFDIQFVTTSWALLRPGSAAHRDKRMRRNVLVDSVAKRGGGYFMFLDADDLVHKDFVSNVITTEAPFGYIVEQGYGIDFGARLVAPIPGVWPDSFHRYCGSCAVFKMELNDQDSGREEAEKKLFKGLRSHVKWKGIMANVGRPLDPVPFPAIAYLLNHGENTHSKLDDKRDQSVRLLMDESGQPITAEFGSQFGIA